MLDFINKCNIEFDKNNGQVTLKERLRLLDKGYLWVIGFIQFQYKGKEGLVNPYANPVKTALLLIKGYGLLDEALSKKWVTLTQPLEGIPDYWVRAKDKEQDKDNKPTIDYTQEQKTKNQETMIVPEMMKVWKKHNPKYPEDANNDYPACLEIAYKIATVKGWQKSSVIDFMELKCLESWDKIVAFIKTDPFLKNLALKNLSNQFQMIFQKMQNKNEELSLNGYSVKPVKKTRAEIEKEMEEWANS